MNAAPITFTQKAGSEIAMLGRLEVGVVTIYPRSARIQAIWTCFMFPTERAASNPARTMKDARRALIARIADWHDLAGAAYADQARALRLQALHHREAAA
jgi:hypothetical protein